MPPLFLVQEDEFLEDVNMAEPEVNVRPAFITLASQLLDITNSQLQINLDSIKTELSVTKQQRAYSERWESRQEALVKLGDIASSQLDSTQRSILLDVVVTPVMTSALIESIKDDRSLVSGWGPSVARLAILYKAIIEQEPAMKSKLNVQLGELALETLRRCSSAVPTVIVNNATSCFLSICAASVQNSALLSNLACMATDSKIDENVVVIALRGLVVMLRAGKLTALKKKEVDLLEDACRAGLCHSKDCARKEGRKLYWALDSYAKTKQLADKLRPHGSRDIQKLNDAKVEAEAEWVEGGNMFNSVCTGVFVPTDNNRLSTPAKVCDMICILLSFGTN